MKKERQKCSVRECGNDASVEVILFDVYTHNGTVFSEQDFTCSYLCPDHIIENEKSAKGERRPRGVVQYAYTNAHSAQGFTVYKPLE